MRWYYEKKELRLAPSIQSGMDPETEGRYRREGARFIIDIGSSMNLSLTTMATGVVYFHRFYMFHTFQDFPRYPTALGCLFLAGKVEETPKKCKDMLKVARDLLPDNKYAQFGGESRNSSEEVMTLERIILQTIKFDLHVEHPYTYLLKYAKCLKGDKARLQKMVQMAWTFVNDSLCTTLSLQWEPEIVAIALMHLAGKLSKFEVVDWNGRTSDHLRWWDMFVEDMTIELLEDICHQVLDLYSQTQQNQAASESPPPPSNNTTSQQRVIPPPHHHLISHPHSAHASPLNNNNTAPLSSSSKGPQQPPLPPPPAAAPVVSSIPSIIPPPHPQVSFPQGIPPPPHHHHHPHHQGYPFVGGHHLPPPMPPGMPPYGGTSHPPPPPLPVGFPTSANKGGIPPPPMPAYMPPPPHGQPPPPQSSSYYPPPPLPPSAAAAPGGPPPPGMMRQFQQQPPPPPK